MRPATINPAVPLVDATVDSLVLSYSFSQFNGTANDRLSLEAYELTEGFAEDKSYYADSPGLTLGPKLGESSFKLRFALVRSNMKVPAYPWLIGDTTRKWADSVRVLRPLRFPVVGSSGDALKQRLLAAIGKTENLSLVNFQAVLKGVALKPKSGTTGAIIGFDPKASDTRLTLYYHLPIPIDTLGQPSRAFVYSLGDAAQERYFTRITTDFNAGEHLKSFTVPAPTAAADTVTAGTATSFTAYLQGGLELGTYIRLSGFEPLLAKKGRIAVNRAELFIPVKPYAAGVYSVPAQAFLAEVDARNQILKTNGQMRLVQASGVDPNDITRPAVATYDATLRAYRVVLTSYLDARLNNKLIDQKGDAFLLLPSLPALNSVSLSRALIDGARGQIKLKVYYSELN